MDIYANPDFRINIRRRAVIRAILAVVLLFLALSSIFGVLGSALTVTVPENVTSARLQMHGTSMDVTLTDPAQIASVTAYLSTIGKVRQAHVDERFWNSGPLETITLYTTDGTQVVYSFHNTGVMSQGREPLMQIRGGDWFWFNDHSGLVALFDQFKPQ